MAEGIKRTINDKFFNDLKGGILRPILDAVKQDSELSLQIRDNYINVYYLGGSLILVKPSWGAKYVGEISAMYNPMRKPGDKSKYTDVINNIADCERVVKTFETRKQWMDAKQKNTNEKRFQQKLYLANNGGIFTVIDTEMQIPMELVNKISRIDMVAIAPIGNGKYRPILVENKYGNNSLNGTAGIRGHVRNYSTLVFSEKHWKPYLLELTKQASMLAELGLRDIPTAFAIDNTVAPEVLFMCGGLSNGAREKVKRDILAEKQELHNNSVAIKYTVKYFEKCDNLRYDGIADWTAE